jgi:hypothetical protein
MPPHALASNSTTKKRARSEHSAAAFRNFSGLLADRQSRIGGVLLKSPHAVGGAARLRPQPLCAD